ncbi:MAG TPA: hypothetical protein EYG85_09730, partial [Crocinitomix sp.]|nr:hypothetical protein [Crocinitomix sp.]
MKKLLLSLGLGILSFTGFTQVQFNLTGTCQYQGNYGLTWTDDSFHDGTGGTQTWNTPNMLDPTKAVSANLVLVQGADPTPHGNCTFDMACNGSPAITNGAALAGKIAVIRRGGCEFGSKAYAAQQAGAIACIIVNAVGDPIGMAGGADGMNVFIPTIMVSATTGAIICDAIAAGCPEAFIGNIAGFYNDNLSLAAGDVYRPGRAMDISWDYTGAADHGFGPGAIVNNLGNNDQLGITVTLDVYEVGNPTAVYSVISAPFNLVGVTITGGIPTVDNTLVDFSAVTPASFVNSTATNQNYELVYTVNAPNADATPIDNEVRSFFGISDTEYSHAQIDPANGKALASAGRGPRTDPGNQPTTDHWMMCNHFSPQTNNVKAVGTKFQAYSYDPLVSTDLIGKIVSCVVYEWVNTKGIYDMTDPGFTTDVDTNSWTELTRVDYFYGGDYQDSIISV